MAVHDRPAAFEGADGFSYSVEIVADANAERGRWGAYFLFVKWRRLGAQTPEGHLESNYVAYSESESAAIQEAARFPLQDVRALLDTAIASREGATPRRRWWDAMNDASDSAAGE
jgi:hypothetical protein